MVDIQVIDNEILFDRAVVGEIKLKNGSIRSRFIDTITHLDDTFVQPGDDAIEIMAATDEALDTFSSLLLEEAKLYDDISITRLKHCIRQARGKN
jgi:hypothetical protein